MRRTLFASLGIPVAALALSVGPAAEAAPVTVHSAPQAEQSTTVDAMTMSEAQILAVNLPGSQAAASARGVRIAKYAKSQIGKRERRGNYYPRAYKFRSYIVRPAEWCGVFVNWAWWKGGATGRPSMRGRGVNQGHWASYWQKWGKRHRRWDKTPAVGDAIVYGNYPKSTHIGVVVGVKYNNTTGHAYKVRTVEGNVGNKVTDKGWRSVRRLKGRGYKASGYVYPG